MASDSDTVTLVGDESSLVPGHGQATSWMRAVDRLQRLTVADGLVALAVVFAIILRFTNLGTPVLSPAEATAALSSWQFGQAGTTVGIVTSPAYFTLTNAAMMLFGSSDAIARLVPALFGTLTVALAWYLRRGWSPAGMVIVAVFMAVSPLNVLASRTAGGEAIAVFALMLLGVSSYRLLSQGSRSWAYGLGAALGLGLTSDPLFISGLVALVPVWWWLSRSAGADETTGRMQLSTYWRPIAIAFGVSFVLLSTSFLLHTPGLGAAFGLVAAWFSAFGLPALNIANGGVFGPLLTALRYEPALIVLGIPALIWALARKDRLGWLLAGWWALLLLLAIFQPALGGYALLFTVPGYLLVGLVARNLFSQPDPDRRITMAVAGGLMLLGAILLVSIARYTRLALWSSDQVAFLVLALVAFVAAGGVLVLAMSYNSVAARQGAFVGLAVLLLYLQWGTSTALTQTGANDPRELVVIEGTDDDVRVLSDLLRDVSRQLTGGDHDLDIMVDGRFTHPALVSARV